MANSAFAHEAAIIMPSSSTNTGVVTWSGTGANNFLDSTVLVSGNNITIPGTITFGGTQITSTAAELNLLDGVSGLVQGDFTKLAAVDATAAELNKLSGASANVTAANLNALTGSGATALHSHSGGGAIADTTGGAATYIPRYTDGDSLLGSASLKFVDDGDGSTLTIDGDSSNARLILKTNASSSSNFRIQWTEGSGNGSTGNMSYEFGHATNSNKFVWYSRATAGISGSAGTGGNILEVEDGTGAFSLPKNPSVSLHHSSSQTVAESTTTALAFDTENWKVGDSTQHSNSSNNSRIYARTAGKYICGGTISYSTHNTGWRYMEIAVNGSEKAFSAGPAVVGTRTRMNVTYLADLDAGDYVEFRAYQSGSSGTLTIERTGNEPNFWMTKVA